MPPKAKTKAAAKSRAGGSANAASGSAGDEPPAKRSKSGTVALWFGTVCAVDFGSPVRGKIAGFDLDLTLIKTKSGKAVASGADDWELWDAAVVPKLQDLHRTGHKVVVIMNYVGLSKGSPKETEMVAKVTMVQAAVGIPMLFLFAAANDRCVKPLPGSWALIQSQFNAGANVSKPLSLFCGDAAGREPPVVKQADASAADLKFALNLGIPFRTPEEMFLGQSKAYDESFPFDPRSLGTAPLEFPVPPLTKQTLIICIGAPGCGKSSTATLRFRECVRVNQDILKSKDKCVKACQAAFDEGKSVIVDNQNRTRADRLPYLELAKAIGVAAIALQYDVPKELCFHLNSYRLLHAGSAFHRAEKVPSSVILKFFQTVHAPKEEEGFERIYRLGLEHFSIDEVGADMALLRGFLA